MDDHSIPNSYSSQEGFFIRPSKWRFDLIRAQRESVSITIGMLRSYEKRMGKIQVVIKKVGRLIREYLETAERVNANIDQATLLSIVVRLKREALGNEPPLGESTDMTATERFLAESLYDEILEISESRAPLLAPAEWEACLEILAESIPRNDFPFSR